jgi:hypothetical protein
MRVLSFCCLLAAGSAVAQTVEVSAGGGLVRMGKAPIGSISTKSPMETDSKFKATAYGYGARVTLNTKGYYGFELGVMEARPTFHTTFTTDSGSTVEEGKARVRMASLNFISYFMPRGERFRPYVTGGGQVYQYGAPRIADWPGGGSRNYGANYGGGIKVRLFPHALFRVDIRDYIGGKPYKNAVTQAMGGRIHQIEGSVGIGIAF